jgi:hypothetical protein
MLTTMLGSEHPDTKIAAATLHRIAAGASPRSLATMPDIQDLLEQGDAAIEAGDFPRAVDLLRRRNELKSSTSSRIHSIVQAAVRVLALECQLFQLLSAGTDYVGCQTGCGSDQGVTTITNGLGFGRRPQSSCTFIQRGLEGNVFPSDDGFKIVVTLHQGDR